MLPPTVYSYHFLSSLKKKKRALNSFWVLVLHVHGRKLQKYIKSIHEKVKIVLTFFFKKALIYILIEFRRKNGGET